MILKNTHNINSSLTFVATDFKPSFWAAFTTLLAIPNDAEQFTIDIAGTALCPMNFSMNDAEPAELINLDDSILEKFKLEG